VERAVPALAGEISKRDTLCATHCAALAVQARDEVIHSEQELGLREAARSSYTTAGKRSNPIASRST